MADALYGLTIVALALVARCVWLAQARRAAEKAARQWQVECRAARETAGQWYTAARRSAVMHAELEYECRRLKDKLDALTPKT